MTQLTSSDVARIVGDVDPETVAAILATGADFAALEQAVHWASGEAEQFGNAHRLTGAAARVHDILLQDPFFAPPDDRQ